MSGPIAGPLATTARSPLPRSDARSPLPRRRTDGALPGAHQGQQLDRLSERDREIISTVARLRFMSGGRLRRLFFAAPSARSRNDRIARRCLARLTAQGWLWRAQRQVGGLGAGSHSWIYGLGSRGARLATDKRRRSPLPSLTFLDHALAVSETYTALHEALMRCELDALDVQTEPACWRSLDDGSGSVFKPDLFVIASTTAADWLAFVEIDLGSEHAGAIARKAALAQAHFESGREQADQGVFPRVVWQARTDARREELRRLLARSPAAALHLVTSPDQLVADLTKGGTP